MKISVREKLSKLLNIILILAFAFQVYASEDSRPGTTENGKDVSRALEKSLLFPGWGQIHEKKYFKGILFMSAELIAITCAVISNRKGNINYNKYRSSVTVDYALLFREKTEKYDRQRNLFIAAGIGIWIINMADIYFFRKKMKKSDLKVSFSKGIRNEVFFTFNYSF